MLSPNRYLERLIELMEHLDERFELTFMLLPGPKGYLEALQRKCRHQARIRCIAPVPMENIVSTIHEFDIGVFLLAPIQKNDLFALPNKLFEFIQARLTSLLSPNPDMAKLVRTYGCGWVSVEEISHFRQKANLASRLLCSKSQQQQFLNLLARK